MRYRISVLALFSVLIVGALAGCGGKSETGEVKSDATPANAGTMKPATTSASGGATTGQSTKPHAE